MVLEPPQVTEQSTSVPQPNDVYSHTAPQPEGNVCYCYVFVEINCV